MNIGLEQLCMIEKKLVWIVKTGKFFPTTDKSLVITCVLNDKVSKTVHS